MVKKILFGLLFLISITAYSQTNYYVKNGGNDAADGLSDVNAWETLSKVNGMDFTAGDTIFFNRGDTWSGQRINPREGTAEQGTEDAPIVFAAYGSGANRLFRCVIAYMDGQVLVIGDCKQLTYMQ
jgi:hypothetical protein